MPISDWSDEALIRKRDAAGYVVLEAVAAAPFPPSNTHSRPCAFICADGHTYWCKGNAPGGPVQRGLLPELVAGRLAARMSVGGPCAIVRVLPSLLPPDGSLAHLEGVVVGAKHHPGATNARELGPLLSGGVLPSAALDARSRARVVVFQTWIGAGDAQVMVGLTDGKIVTIDHGDCFGNHATPSRPAPVVVDIPGVSADFGREPDLVAAAIDDLEAISDEELLEYVARVPGGDAWGSEVPRRLAIASWLAHRRGQMREVMREWTRM